MRHTATVQRSGLDLDDLVSRKEWFEHYVNPYEALQITELAIGENLEPQAIQRAKRRLLQEIELNDGKVSWLENSIFDASRAHKLDDELLDPSKARYHRMIFQDKKLLRFLTRGDIMVFFASDGPYPQATLDELEKDSSFRKFLGKAFARQYDVVLTRAIERRLPSVIKAILNGQQWVLPEDWDVCFEGASRRIDELVEKVRSNARDVRDRKVSLGEFEDLLRQNSIIDLFNMLPVTFAPRQKEMVEAIRSLALDLWKEHCDADLVKAVLDLCKQFTCRNVGLSKRLEDDLTAIERIIADERTHSFSALVRSNRRIQISKAGITYGGDSMKASEIEAIRWGEFVRTENGIEAEHSFTFTLRNAHYCISVNWHKPGIFSAMSRLFRKGGDPAPVADLPSAEQEVFFQKMIDAALYHLVPSVLDTFLGRLRAGNSLVIGVCTLSQNGVIIRRSVSSLAGDLPWHDVVVQAHMGHISVMSRMNFKSHATMPAKDVDNAVLLPILSEMMKKELGLSNVAQQQAFEAPPIPQKPPALAKKIGGTIGAFLAIGVVILCAGLISVSQRSHRPLRQPAPSPTYSYPSPSPSYRYPINPTSTSWGDVERQAIERERAEAERMESELKLLDAQIERERILLDRTNEFDVAEFNRKVRAFNELLERCRAQERRVNGLVDDYNSKLQERRR